MMSRRTVTPFAGNDKEEPAFSPLKHIRGCSRNKNSTRLGLLTARPLCQLQAPLHGSEEALHEPLVYLWP